LKKIKKSGELLMSLINDTLDLSKIENGQILLQKTPASLCELFKKIATSVAPSIAEKSLHFGFAIKPRESRSGLDRCPQSHGNHQQSSFERHQIHPGRRPRELSLDATNEKPSQLLTTIIVKDDGVGMSEAFLAKALSLSVRSGPRRTPISAVRGLVFRSCANSSISWAGKSRSIPPWAPRHRDSRSSFRWKKPRLP
jgi:signal transduction histidine kinase